jgi:hypothetical protein
MSRTTRKAGGLGKPSRGTHRASTALEGLEESRHKGVNLDIYVGGAAYFDEDVPPELARGQMRSLKIQMRGGHQEVRDRRTYRNSPT